MSLLQLMEVFRRAQSSIPVIAPSLWLRNISQFIILSSYTKQGDLKKKKKQFCWRAYFLWKCRHQVRLAVQGTLGKPVIALKRLLFHFQCWIVKQTKLSKKAIRTWSSNFLSLMIKYPFFHSISYAHYRIYTVFYTHVHKLLCYI